MPALTLPNPIAVAGDEEPVEFLTFQYSATNYTPSSASLNSTPNSAGFSESGIPQVCSALTYEEYRSGDKNGTRRCTPTITPGVGSCIDKIDKVVILPIFGIQDATIPVEDGRYGDSISGD